MRRLAWLIALPVLASALLAQPQPDPAPTPDASAGDLPVGTDLEDMPQVAPIEQSGASLLDRPPMPEVEKLTVSLGPAGKAKVLFTRPAKVRRGQRHALIVALPPGDGSERLGRAALELYWARGAATRDMFVAVPIGKAGLAFSEGGAKLVAPLVDALVAQHPIDPTLIFLAGSGDGGIGALRVALDHKGKFCALLGVPIGLRDPSWLRQADQLAGLPVYLRVGRLDRSSLSATRQVAEALTQAGARVDLEELPSQGAALELDEAGLFGWIEEVRRAVTREGQRLPPVRGHGPTPTPKPPTTQPAASPSSRTAA